VIPISLMEAAFAIGAHLVGARPLADGAPVVTGVSIDSRTAAAGDLFVAIKGENFDGHGFVADALERGAVAAVVTRDVGIADRVIMVDDTVTALGRLAHAVLGKSSCSVIAITGSSGKTTTKDILAQLLGEIGPTVAAIGSNNNEIGVPMTVLSIDESTKHLVLEMGARGVGHIDYLCSIARPDIAVVLNVGTAHVGEFGTREATARAKAEIVAATRPDGVVVLNADDLLVAAMADRVTAHVMTFGDQGDVRARDVQLDEYGRALFVLEYHGARADVQLRVYGAHQVSNALAAASVAFTLGADVSDVAAGLSRAEPSSHWRMEVSTTPSGITLVNDAYNANPESMAAALSALSAMGKGRRTWAVLGEMRELGRTSGEAHERMGALAVEMGVSRLVVVGSGARGILDGALRAGMGLEDSVYLPDVQGVSELLTSQARPGDVILVKASRAVGLERVAAHLHSSPTHGGSPPVEEHVGDPA